MLVKFFRHGSGSGAGPLNYLLGSDRKREDAKVLYGDPVMTEQLINATPFKQKYKSGVLSFTEQADTFTDKQKMDIMRRFEKTLFAGLAPDQYDILWIEHRDKSTPIETGEFGEVINSNGNVGRLELNFVIPCMELRSGKSLQPFFAGADLVRVNAFKNIINHEYKLTNPDDPVRKREVNPYVNNAPRPAPYDVKRHNNYENKEEKKNREKDDETIKNPFSHQMLKEAIDKKMLRLLNKSLINDRFGVSYRMQQWGLTIERKTKSSISVSHPNIKKNIRLKGFIYEENFDGMKALPQNKQKYQESFDDNSSCRYKNDLKTWQTGMAKKEAYHQTLYGDIKAPEPLELNIKVTLPDDQPKIEPESITLQPSYRPSPF